MAKTKEKTKSQQAALERLRKTYEAAEVTKADAEYKLVLSMEKAHESGIALREIGEVIGVSHVTVMRMMRG